MGRQPSLARATEQIHWSQITYVTLSLLVVLLGELAAALRPVRPGVVRVGPEVAPAQLQAHSPVGGERVDVRPAPGCRTGRR